MARGGHGAVGGQAQVKALEALEGPDDNVKSMAGNLTRRSATSPSHDGGGPRRAQQKITVSARRDLG